MNQETLYIEMSHLRLTFITQILINLRKASINGTYFLKTLKQ